jgi:hypothetical protein
LAVDGYAPPLLNHVRREVFGKGLEAAVLGRNTPDAEDTKVRLVRA